MNIKKIIKTIIDRKPKEKNWWMDTYADFGDEVGKVYDYQVADYAKKHLRFLDRFNMRKVGAAMMYSFEILSKSTEEPDLKKNWKYFKDF